MSVAKRHKILSVTKQQFKVIKVNVEKRHSKAMRHRYSKCRKAT